MVGPNEWTVTGALRDWDLRPRLGGPFLDAREGRGEHEAREPTVARERVLEGEHPAPRRAEHVHPPEPELVAEGGQLGQEDADAPLDPLGPVGAPAAELVVEGDGTPALGQPLQGLEVVMRRAGAAVEAEERVAAVPALPDDPVPGSMPVEDDVPLPSLQPQPRSTWEPPTIAWRPSAKRIRALWVPS
jgi:hypothetical protein